MAAFNDTKARQWGWRLGVILLFVPACPGYLEQGAWLGAGGAGGAVGAMGVAGSTGAATGGLGGAVAMGGTGGMGAVGGGQNIEPADPMGGQGGEPMAGAGGAGGAIAMPLALPGCASPEVIASQILGPKCGKCHGGNMPPGGLDLLSPGAKVRLLGVPAKTCRGDKQGDPLIETEDGKVSGILFEKLAGEVEGCGKQMPLMGTPLSEQEIVCLQAWITPQAAPADAGAPAAEPPGYNAACATDSEITSKILQPKCNDGLCHGTAVKAGLLDLEASGVKQRLRNAMVTAGACRQKKMVEDGAVGGHFFDKLRGAVPGCGGQMPFLKPPLSEGEIKCLQEWLKN